MRTDPRTPWAALIVITLAPTASGAVLPTDLIVDEFDDPVSIDSPFFGPTGSTKFVDQENVGPLGARRRTQVVDINVNSEGNLTVDNSELRMHIVSANPDEGAGPTTTLLGFGTTYNLASTVDLVAEGLDAVAIDFAEFDSSFGLLPRITVFLKSQRYGNLNFVSERFDVPLTDQSSTLLFPIDAFGARGGGGQGVLFDAVFEVRLSISVSSFLTQPSQDLSFSSTIERVRFTTIGVPEPGGSVLATMLVGCSLVRVPGRC